MNPPGCKFCSKPIKDFSASHCECGEFIGFPNFRKAESQRDALDERHRLASLAAKNASEQIRTVNRLAEESLPTINMNCDAAHGILRSGKYQNYYQRVKADLRGKAKEADHADRDAVGAKIFTGYFVHVVYAALCPKSRGLSSYGELSFAWRVYPELERRISVLEENSFDFYERHKLGERGKTPPEGYMGVWNDRTKIAVSKLAGSLDENTRETEVEAFFFAEDGKRDSDRFIEVNIYQEKGLSTEGLDSVSISKPLSPNVDQDYLELIKQAVLKLGCRFFEEAGATVSSSPGNLKTNRFKT